MPLTASDTRKLIAGAVAKASELNLKVTIAVVDEGGFLLGLERMDGAAPLTAQIAEAKAVGAAVFHRDGATLAQIAQDRPGFFSAIDRMVRTPLIPGPGSVIIRRGDAVLGAVGVSGARPEQDLECAEAGVASIG